MTARSRDGCARAIAGARVDDGRAARVTGPFRRPATSVRRATALT